MKSLRPLFIVVLVLFAILLSLWAYVSSVSYRSSTPSEQESLAESYDEVEDDTTFMEVSNQEVLYKLMPKIATPVINQVFAQYYEKSGVLARYATIDSAVSQSGSNYTFVVQFDETNKKQKVTVTVKNTATSDFDIKLEDV